MLMKLIKITCYDTDDILKVIGSKVKVKDNFSGGSVPVDVLPLKTI